MKFVKDRRFETEQLVKLLSTTAVGETITYKQMSEACGCEVKSTSGFLTSARRIVLNDDRCVFVSVRNVGLKRATDVDIATSVSDGDVKKSRRHAKRALKKLGSVDDFSAMPNHAQLKHVIKSSFFGAVAFLAQRGKLNEIAKAATGRCSELPVKETLKLFTKE